MLVDNAADNEAQVNLWSVDSVKSGYSERDLIKVAQKISATSSQLTESAGAMLSVMKVNSGETNLMAFVSRGVQHLQLSRIALKVQQAKSVPMAEDAKTRTEKDGTAESPGIINKWPNGAPTSGLRRMVRVPIPNKIPWRTGSLAPLDMSCKRETHATVHVYEQLPRQVTASLTMGPGG